MIVENSMFVADYFGGFYDALAVITLVCIFLGALVCIGAEWNKKSAYWLIPIGLELLFALWFFCTFSIKG